MENCSYQSAICLVSEGIESESKIPKPILLTPELKVTPSDAEQALWSLNHSLSSMLESAPAPPSLRAQLFPGNEACLTKRSVVAWRYYLFLFSSIDT